MICRFTSKAREGKQSLPPTPLPLTFQLWGHCTWSVRMPPKGCPSLSQAAVLYLDPILANGASSGAKGKQGAQKSSVKLPFGVRIYDSAH